MPIPQDYLDMLAELYMEDVEVVHEWSSDPPMTNGIFSSFLHPIQTDCQGFLTSPTPHRRRGQDLWSDTNGNSYHQFHQMNGNQGYAEVRQPLSNMLPPSHISSEYGRSNDHNQYGNRQNHQGNQEWHRRVAPNLDDLPPSSDHIIEFGSDPSYGRNVPQVQAQESTAPHQGTEAHIQPVNGDGDEYDFDHDANWLNEIDLKELDKIPPIISSSCKYISSLKLT